MDQTTQVELVRRVLGLVKARSTDMAEDEARARVEDYVSPERFERERALFRRLPLIVASAGQLAEPGDYLTHDESGVPLLVVRTREGEVAAFLNVCRHRGTRLVMEAQGRRKHAFVCPYHAWTYGEDGRLKNVPHAEGFPSKPSESVGLVRLPAVERFGLVWVVPSPMDAYDFDAYLSPLSELEGLSLGTHVPHRPETFRRALNWKVGVEIFLEAYHVRHAHHASIAPLFFDNVAVVDRLGPYHQRLIYPKRTLVELESTPPETWALRRHANILYVPFPNVMVLVQPDFVSLLHIFPGRTPDESAMRAVHLLPKKPETEKAARFFEKNVDLVMSAIQEDFAMGESIQAGVRSGANAEVRFGRYEQGLAYFRESLERLLAGG